MAFLAKAGAFATAVLNMMEPKELFKSDGTRLREERERMVALMKEQHTILLQRAQESGFTEEQAKFLLLAFAPAHHVHTYYNDLHTRMTGSALQ